jgi:uncharacterized linocin/CFP29 family protein
MKRIHDVNVDLLGQNRAQGMVAQHILSNKRLNPGSMKPFIAEDNNVYITVFAGGDPKNPKNYKAIPFQGNATLRRDEWKRLDDAVMGLAEFRLGGVQDLIDNGLTYPLGNAMGTTVLETHDVGDALEAEVTMDGVTRAQNDRPEWKYRYLPIPIIHADYEINTRELENSRNMGNAIDTTMAERAGRKIAVKLEQMLFTDTTYSWGEKDEYNENTIYSYLNFPDRNQVTLTVNWDASGKTGKDIVDEVLSMKQASLDAFHYGPNWMLYIPSAYETIIDEDYVASNPDTRTDSTIRERILKIAGIQGIKVIDTLPANNILLVEMNTSNVRLIQGMGVQNVQWQEEGRFLNKYKVLTIQVPQLRSDQNGNCGIVHLAA